MSQLFGINEDGYTSLPMNVWLVEGALIYFCPKVELTSNSTSQGPSINEVPILRVGGSGKMLDGWTVRLHLLKETPEKRLKKKIALAIN